MVSQKGHNRITGGWVPVFASYRRASVDGCLKLPMNEQAWIHMGEIPAACPGLMRRFEVERLLPLCFCSMILFIRRGGDFQRCQLGFLPG